MQKSALTGLVALGLVEISAATPAVAQDVTPFLGPYIGVHGGHAWGSANFTSDAYNIFGTGGFAPARNDTFSPDGFMVGGHGGMNFELGSNTIVGLEVDGSYLGGSDSVSMPETLVSNDGVTLQYRSDLDFNWQGTFRGRLGWVAGNSLIYATAGLALLNVDWSETADCSFCQPLTSSKSETLVGGAFGAGVDMVISPSVLLGADYLYETFGSIDNVPHGAGNVPPGAGSGQTGRLGDIHVHKVRARLTVNIGDIVP